MSEIGRSSTSNPERTPAATRRLGRGLYFAAVIPLSLGVFALALTNPGTDGHEHAEIREMIRGTADQPYARRALLPLLIRAGLACVPADALGRLNQSTARQPLIAEFGGMLNFDPGQAVEYALALLLMFASLWGFLRSLRYLLDGVYRASPRTRDAFILAALVGLALFFRRRGYLYDFPALFLFTLGLALLVRRRWPAYLFVYALACLNKETTILLAAAYVLNFGRDAATTRGRFWALLAAQVAIFGVITAALAAAFRDNPGSAVEWRLPHQNLGLFASYPLAALFLLCGVVLLFCEWSDKPAFLRRSLWIVPPLAAWALLFGRLDEPRDYIEAYPIAALLLLHSVCRLWKFELADRGRP